MTMSDLEPLREALRHRLAVVADRDLYERDAHAHLVALVAASAEVDRLAAQVPADADPTLRHYLDRQSYVKALGWLNEPAAHHG